MHFKCNGARWLMERMESPTHGEDTPPPSLLVIFFTFLILGFTAFGGPAMVAYIRKVTVERKQWLNEATFADGVAFCQIIPGATAMQVAGYVGLKKRGISGAFMAYSGFALPAFVLIMVLSAIYVQNQLLPQLLSIFSGLRAFVVAIVAYGAVSLARLYLKICRDLFIVIVAAILFGFGVNPIAVVIIAGCVGILLYHQNITSNQKIPKRIPTAHLSRVISLVFLVTIAFGFLFVFWPTLSELAVSMVRVDLFAFGGGFAALPLMYHEVVVAHGWMDGQTFMDGIALGQVTPGPIVITATFVGYLVGGIAGGIVATIGMFIGSFFLVIALVPYFDHLKRSLIFRHAVNGVLLSFIGLLASVTVQFFHAIPWNIPLVTLAVGAFIALLVGVEILWVVLIVVIIAPFLL